MNRKNLSAWVVILILASCGPGRAADTNTLHDKVAKPSPSAADETYLYDISSGSLKKTTFSALPLSTAQQSALASKAEKSLTVQDWSAWPNGSVFVANMLVAYQGQIYKCLQPYTKNSGDTPAAFAAYWSVTGGGVTSYTALTDKPTIPGSLADLSADSTHRVVTDAEKTTWNGKESALGAPATSDWCLKSDTSGVRAWGACGSFDASGSYSPTGTWDFTSATLAGVPKTSDFVTFSASSPLSFNPLTGALSMVTHAYQAYDANMIPWPAAVSATEISYLDGATSNLQTQINAIPAGGFVPTDVTTDPTTRSPAGLYVNTATGHMFIVGSTGMVDVAGTWTAAPARPLIDDNFATDTSANYTNIAQTLSISGGVANGTAWNTTVAYNETPSGSTNHWVSGTVYLGANSDNSGLILGSNGTQYYYSDLSTTGIKIWSNNNSWCASYTGTYTPGSSHQLAIQIDTDGSSHARFNAWVDGTKVITDLVDTGNNVTRGQYVGLRIKRNSSNDAAVFVDDLKANSGVYTP